MKFARFPPCATIFIAKKQFFAPQSRTQVLILDEQLVKSYIFCPSIENFPGYMNLTEKNY